MVNQDKDSNIVNVNETINIIPQKCQK